QPEGERSDQRDDQRTERDRPHPAPRPQFLGGTATLGSAGMGGSVRARLPPPVNELHFRCARRLTHFKAPNRAQRSILWWQVSTICRKNSRQHCREKCKNGSASQPCSH